MNKFGIKHDEQNHNSFYKIVPEDTLNLDLAIPFYVKHIMFHGSYINGIIWFRDMQIRAVRTKLASAILTKVTALSLMSFFALLYFANIVLTYS